MRRQCGGFRGQEGERAAFSERGRRGAFSEAGRGSRPRKEAVNGCNHRKGGRDSTAQPTVDGGERGKRWSEPPPPKGKTAVMPGGVLRTMFELKKKEKRRLRKGEKGKTGTLILRPRGKEGEIF